MIVAGIDLGAKTVKVVILKDGKIIGKSKTLSGIEQDKTVLEAYNAALAEAGIAREDVSRVIATGAGREYVSFADNDITEVGADAKGVINLVPNARTIIDVGAEEGRGIKIDASGRVIDFAVNEKCAAGAGSFTESMARALELTLEKFGQLSLESTQEIPMNAQCAVFAESEVVSMLHNKTPKADISRAVHDAIASRISSMVRKVGFEAEIVLIGGMAYNNGFIRSLENDLKYKLIIPENPEFIGAYGAALAAMGG